MSPDSSRPWLRFVIIGCLTRDYILPINGSPQLDTLGGSLPYTAVGLNLWGNTAGMLAKVGEDFPMHRLDRFRDLGFDLTGIKALPGSVDLRRFMAHIDSDTTQYENPVQHFADRGLTYPPKLMGYRTGKSIISSRTTPLKNSIQFSDIPEAYFEATAVHICPIDYLSHLVLPSIFHQGQASTITLSSSPGYMDPSFWEEIPALLSDLTAFFTSEAEIRRLFQARTSDLWGMAETLAGYGPEYILIQTTSWGYYLYDGISKTRLIIPNYTTTIVDPTGAADAFIGGFIAGYRENYDPVDAAVMGSIAASLVIEGSGVFFALDSLPSLKDARRTALRDLVREV